MVLIADRTQTRRVKFRSYIACITIPMAIAGVLNFTTPGFGTTGKLVYAYISYMLLMTLYNSVNVPYSALMGVFMPNSIELTEVSYYRFLHAFVGLVVVCVESFGLMA